MTDKRPDIPKTPPAIRLDMEAFLPYLEGSDLSEAQKREFVETLWSIVVSFVDLGFALNPTQQVCGETLDLNAVLMACASGEIVAFPLSKNEDGEDQKRSAKGGRP